MKNQSALKAAVRELPAAASVVVKLSKEKRGPDSKCHRPFGKLLPVFYMGKQIPTPSPARKISHRDDGLPVTGRKAPSGVGAPPGFLETSQSFPDSAVQKFELPNGLRLLVKEDHRLPFVDFCVAFRGGLCAETPADKGLTQVMARMLLQGTATRSSKQVAEAIESVGGYIDVFDGYHSFGVTAEVLADDFALGLGLVADVMRNPKFPAAALERERAIQLAVIKDRRDDLSALCAQLMLQKLFGDTGYGLEALGSQASVCRLQTADLKAFHARLVVPDNCVLAIYGDVKAGQVRTAVEQVFANWQPSGAGSPLRAARTGAPDAPEVTRPTRVSETCDKKQVILTLGFAGTTVFDADRYALELLQQACTDSGSRLFARVREQLGLAYSVGAQHVPGLVGPGFFMFYASTAPEHAKRVEEEMWQEARLLGAEGLRAEELKRTKALILGQQKIARQELDELAECDALEELYGLGYAHSDRRAAEYEAVTPERIQAVAQKYLNPASAVIAVISPASRGVDSVSLGKTADRWAKPPDLWPSGGGRAAWVRSL